MSSTTYAVSGMTCEHCAASVKEEISAIPGVESVTVDLESGSVAVDGTGFTDDAVDAAIQEAGYTLVR